MTYSTLFEIHPARRPGPDMMVAGRREEAGGIAAAVISRSMTPELRNLHGSPSLDGEGTFAMLHALVPFYSVLIRVNPENPSAPPSRSRRMTERLTRSRSART
jgi:hypothetical protein